MNGAHDLGGAMGFGPVDPDKNEPVFHADWEKRAFGITTCCDGLGAWTIDESRFAIESIPPVEYLSGSYYQNWIRGLETLLLRHGFVTKAELTVGVGQADDPRASRAVTPDKVDELLASGVCQKPISNRPRFSPGQQVRTKNIHPAGHTRLPRYARGKIGVIETVQGSFTFPDDSAHGKPDSAQWLYTVVFPGTELWGEAADKSLHVSIDAWESYLDD